MTDFEHEQEIVDAYFATGFSQQRPSKFLYTPRVEKDG
jgi:hypothetical protein